MAVQVAERHSHVQTLVSVVKMAVVLEKYTIEGQRSVVRFCVGKRLNTKDIYKEMFPVYGGKCLSRKAIQPSWQTEVRKWLRQQSNDVYAAGFDALVKRWDTFIGVGGGYVEK
jgi:hypothetical protein